VLCGPAAGALGRGGAGERQMTEATAVVAVSFHNAPSSSAAWAGGPWDGLSVSAAAAHRSHRCLIVVQRCADHVLNINDRLLAIVPK